MRGGGRSLSPGGPGPGPTPSPRFLFKRGPPVQYPGSTFPAPCRNLPGSWELLRETFTEEKPEAVKGHVTLHTSRARDYNPGSAPAKPSRVRQNFCLQHLGGGF